MSKKIDIKSLVIPTRLTELGQKRELVSVPIRKPFRQEWTHIHPDEGWQIGPVATLTDRSDLSTYVVAPEVADDLERGLLDYVALYTAITTAGAIMLWPARITDRMNDEWANSMLEAVEKAKHGWVRVSANMAASTYEVHSPVGEIADPAWPEGVTFEKVTDLALKNRLIDTWDHPVLRRINGDF